MKTPKVVPLIAALIACWSASAAGKDLAGQIRMLKTRVAELERRVAELEGEHKPRMTVTVHYGPVAKGSKPGLDGPLGDVERTVVARARESVVALEKEIGRHTRQLSKYAGQDRETTVVRWAEASAGLAGLLAKYGQERACLGALAAFHSGKDRGRRAQAIFEMSAYRCAATLAEQWDSPNAAMRIATTYGPKATEWADDWGGLADRAAAATGRRHYRRLALDLYLRAVAFDPRLAAAWSRVRALERELGRDS